MDNFSFICYIILWLLLITKIGCIQYNTAEIGVTSITVTPGSYEYDGKAKTPAVTIKDGTKTLVKDTDFTVAYENNSGIGDNTAKAVVTGNVTSDLGDITNYDRITLLEELLKNQNEMVKLSVSWYKKDSQTGIAAIDFAHHAIAAYGIEDAYYASDITNETYDRRILIYDPNTTPAPTSDAGVNREECIYYNSKTHSYIRPSQTNDKFTFYWTNPTKENPETDESMGSDLPRGVIYQVCVCGSYAQTVYNMPAIKSALNPNGIPVWLKKGESRYP